MQGLLLVIRVHLNVPTLARLLVRTQAHEQGFAAAWRLRSAPHPADSVGRVSRVCVGGVVHSMPSVPAGGDSGISCRALKIAEAEKGVCFVRYRVDQPHWVRCITRSSAVGDCWRGCRHSVSIRPHTLAPRPLSGHLSAHPRITPRVACDRNHSEQSHSLHWCPFQCTMTHPVHSPQTCPRFPCPRVALSAAEACCLACASSDPLSSAICIDTAFFHSEKHTVNCTL